MDDMYEVKQAAIKAVLLLGQKCPSQWEYQEAAAQFKKAAEVCRLRMEKMEQDLTNNKNKG